MMEECRSRIRLPLRSFSVSLAARADGYHRHGRARRRVAGRARSSPSTVFWEADRLIRPTPAVEAIPATTPFIGPEQLMRETGQRELVRLGANESAFGPSPQAVAAMSGELPRLSWYGDPESLDLRDALAEKHGAAPKRSSSAPASTT